MNIVFVSMRSTVSYLGGAEILTQVIAESLVQLGHNVVIYTAGFGGGSVVRGVRIRETPLLSFPMRLRTTLLPIYSWLLAGFFRRINDFHQADIVHAIDSDAIMLMAGWSFMRTKFVATIQDYTLIWPMKDYYSDATTSQQFISPVKELAAQIRKIVKLRAVSRLRFAVCVSRFVADEVRKVNPRTRLVVIGNCISPLWQGRHKPTMRDIDILYVGKLMPYKGVDVLLRAISLLPAAQQLRAIIVGEGLSKRYAALASKLGITDRVEFTGPVPYVETPNYYLRSKIVVSPSLWPEPCGRSIIEAMWSGCAVVATKVGGTPESLIDRSHGYLVSPDSPKAIADACQKLLAHDKIRERCGSEASSYARIHYSSDTIAREYQRFYGLIKSS